LMLNEVGVLGDVWRVLVGLVGLRTVESTPPVCWEGRAPVKD